MDSEIKMQSLPTLAELKLEHFTALLDCEFLLQLPEGGTISLKLGEARAFGHSGSGEGFRAPFSLIFRCPTLPNDQYLRQGLYRISEAQLGVLEILITPITPDHHGMRYEAVFS